MGRRAASGSRRGTTRRLGVVLVDPLPVVRAGLRLLIDDRPDMEVIAEGGSALEGLEVVTRIRRTRVVILVGLGLAGEHDAYWLIRTLRERAPAHAVLGVGANAEPSMISRALFMGADGYLDKTVDPGEFLAALRRAADGEVVLGTPPHVSVGDIAVGLDRRRQLDVRLTEREREVLEVAAEGLTARQIAERLGVRERTVTTHLARIYAKLGVGTRMAAIRTAARSGLVSSAAPE
jgi:DNA-binding NarL/FixJ family response regulator